MSQNTHKAQYIQLMEWLPTLSSKNKKPRTTGNQPQSRLDNYKNKGVR
jgi:hypothetical protein